MNSPVLSIKKVSKSFPVGGGSTKIAVDRVSLTVPQGQFVTVIGSNGAGKSTLLNLVAGRYIPDTGTISLNGTDITNLSEHRRAAFIGRVFQDPLGYGGVHDHRGKPQHGRVRVCAARARRGVTKERRARFREPRRARFRFGGPAPQRSGLLSAGRDSPFRS